MRADAALVCFLCVMPSAFAQDQTVLVGCSRSGASDLNISQAREGGLLPVLATRDRKPGSGNAGIVQPATCGHVPRTENHNARTENIVTRGEQPRLCTVSHKTVGSAKYSIAFKH
jgi:hypothetical protein